MFQCLCTNSVVFRQNKRTWRTFMKDRRQSWTALWWLLWKTSGCNSSKMASALLKNVMWFCCRNSCIFKWTRPCKRPAIMGKCLDLKKNTSLNTKVQEWKFQNSNIIYIFLPEQKNRVWHCQFPTSKVGIRDTALSGLWVSNVSEQCDQTMYQHIKLRNTNLYHHRLLSLQQKWI